MMLITAAIDHLMSSRTNWRTCLVSKMRLLLIASLGLGGLAGCTADSIDLPSSGGEVSEDTAGEHDVGADGSQQQPSAVCEPNSRRCAADTPEICTASGDAWSVGEACSNGCAQGRCIRLIADTEIAGEIHAPQEAVVIGDNVRVTPHGSADEGGRLRVEAAVIIIEGTLDATGAGFDGGGGGGGGGGGHRHETHGASGAGGAGVNPGAPGGAESGCGSDKHGSSGGQGGAGAGPFAGTGGSGGECENYSYAGLPGQAGGRGGYAGGGTNGDDSVDDSVEIGSGGGGGGGGSGGGNGNGEGGGGGGGGAAGGAGGAAVELVATEHLRIDGAVLANGTRGGDGAAGQSAVRTGSQTGHGGDGGAGGSAETIAGGQGGAGGSFEGGGTLGGAGAAGGVGAGGGILLVVEQPGGLSLDGTIETLGGDGATTNGGTVKMRYAQPALSLQAQINAGRVHTLVYGEDVVPCLPACPGAQTCDDATGSCEEPAACAHDTDCLGPRICQESACANPPDAELPVVDITAPTSASSWSTTHSQVDMGGTATDNEAVTRVEYRVDSSDWSACSGTSNWSCAGISLNIGSQQIDIRALDAAGNAGLATLAVDRQEDDTGPGPDTTYREVPSDFSGVTWLHHNVAGWPQTATLSDVYISGSHIHLPYDKAGQWPIGHYDSNAPDVVANPWIFIYHDDQWYAATWEWMRPNQTFKNKAAVAGDHIKRDPFWNWQPQSGVWYGFMLSGMARNHVRNVEERSNVVMFQWP